MTFRRVTLFGGSGFLGRYIVERLADREMIVTVAVRDTEAAKFLVPLGDVGQIVPVCASVTHQKSVDAVVAGADAVINLVGILHQRGTQTFKAVHSDGAARVAKAAAAAGARRMIHVSAIGADRRALSEYGRSKAAGEDGVRAAFAAADIVRPSLLFGAEDRFFNLFAGFARIAPVLPLYGGGRTRFQPVYVGDAADGVVALLAREGGKTYELGGPRIYSFAALLRLMLEVIGRRRILLPLPYSVGALQAMFLEMLPNPPITRDQLKQLRSDNIVAEGALTLADLGINPTALEMVLPTYLARYRRGGRLGRMSVA